MGDAHALGHKPELYLVQVASWKLASKVENGKNPDKMPNCRVKEAVIGKKCKDNFVLKWLKDV